MLFGGCFRPSRFNQLLKSLAILGQVDRIRRRTDNRRAGRFQIARQLQRCLAAVLHDDAFGLFLVDDLHDVFERQRLEIQPIRRVVIRRHGLRIAVDHDGLVARLLERQRRMHAAIVELDALADAVRPTAENHDLALVGRLRLALLLIGRVHVRRVGRKLGGTGIDALEHRTDAELQAPLAHCLLGNAGQLGNTRIAKPLRLMRRTRSSFSPASLPLRSLLRFRQDRRSAPGTTDRCPSASQHPRTCSRAAWHRPHTAAAPRPGMRNSCRKASRSASVSTDLTRLIQAGIAGFQATQRFLQDSWNVRPIAMTSPTDFICVVRRSLAPGNFSKVKRGILVTT